MCYIALVVGGKQLNLTVSALNILCGLGILRIEKQLLGPTVLDQFAHEHEDALPRSASRLRHVMRDDENGVAAGKTPHEFLNRACAADVQGTARLVHENDLRFERKEPGNAELLLLFELQGRRLRGQFVFEIVPEPDLGQCLLHCGFQFRSSQALIVNTQAEDDIFINGYRERIRSLKNHPDAFAQFDEGNIFVIDILPVEDDFAGGRDVSVAFIDPIKTAQQRRFSATARPNERRDFAVVDVDGDIFKCLEFAIPKADVPGLDAMSAFLTHQPKIPFT